MAYESTEVPVARSQEAIRKLIMQHNGFGIAFVSEREPEGTFAQEGFQAKVLIDNKPYAVRIMATVRPSPRRVTEKHAVTFREREERRIWRVLYYHLKSVFEAADSGVMEFRELMLPYLITGDGKTVAERLIPRLDELVVSNPNRMLTGGTE